MKLFFATVKNETTPSDQSERSIQQCRGIMWSGSHSFSGCALTLMSEARQEKEQVHQISVRRLTPRRMFLTPARHHSLFFRLSAALRYLFSSAVCVSCCLESASPTAQRGRLTAVLDIFVLSIFWRRSSSLCFVTLLPGACLIRNLTEVQSNFCLNL